MASNIHVYKISDRLYRVRNKERNTVKDVWISFGEIVPPDNPYNTLTTTEQMAIDMELF